MPSLPLQKRWILFRDRIISTIIPRMAFENPFRSQSDTFQNSVLLHSFIGILATSRMKSADSPRMEMRKYALVQRKDFLIYPYGEQQCLLHISKLSEHFYFVNKQKSVYNLSGTNINKNEKIRFIPKFDMDRFFPSRLRRYNLSSGKF